MYLESGRSILDTAVVIFQKSVVLIGDSREFVDDRGQVMHVVL
jgi:hypothetical protein